MALTKIAIVGMAIKAFDNLIDIYREESNKQLIMKWDHLKELYELELAKPKYDPRKTAEQNAYARSNDTLLNVRDKLLRYGETLTAQLRQQKGKE